MNHVFVRMKMHLNCTIFSIFIVLKDDKIYLTGILLIHRRISEFFCMFLYPILRQTVVYNIFSNGKHASVNLNNILHTLKYFKNNYGNEIVHRQTNKQINFSDKPFSVRKTFKKVNLSVHSFQLLRKSLA